jgi:hypothetical protein
MHKTEATTDTVTIPPDGLLPGELWGEWPRCLDIAQLFSREGRALSARMLRARNNGYDVKLSSPALQIDDGSGNRKLQQAARYETRAMVLLLKAQDLRKEEDRKRLWAELKSDSDDERMAINERIWKEERKARIAFAEELYYATMPGTTEGSSADARERTDEKNERTNIEHSTFNVQHRMNGNGKENTAEARRTQRTDGKKERTNIEHSTFNVQRRMSDNGKTNGICEPALKGQNVVAQGQDAGGGRSPGKDAPHNPPRPEGAQEETNGNLAIERKRANGDVTANSSGEYEDCESLLRKAFRPIKNWSETPTDSCRSPLPSTPQLRNDGICNNGRRAKAHSTSSSTNAAIRGP